MNVKKKLLFVNGHLHVGGGEKSLLSLLTYLDYSRYEVDLLLLEDKGEYLELLPPQVNVLFVDTTKAYGSFFLTMLQAIKTGQFYTVWYRLVILLSSFLGKKWMLLIKCVLPISSHYNCAISYRPGPCADIVAFAVNAEKKLCWWHNGKCDYTISQIKEVDMTWSYFDYIISVSEGCKQMITEHFTFPAERIIVIPNMIDIDEINLKADSENPYNDNAKLRLITVCRLSNEKHLENAIYAVSKFDVEKRKGLKWYIVGDGPEKHNLRLLIQQNNLQNIIILLGQKINPYPYIKFADIFVSTSYQESQGLSILEAMALKVPCVITETIGTKEYAVDKWNCILTEPNREALLKALLVMINSLARTGSFIDNAFTAVSSNYRKEVIISKFQSFVDSSCQF